MCPFHSWLVTPSLSTKVTESHRSITLTCGVDVLLRDLWEDQAQQSSVIHEPMVQNQVRRNKRWIIEWFTLHFSMLPPEFCLSEFDSAKKESNTALSNISMLPYVINTSSQKEWTRWVGASAQLLNQIQLDLGFFLLLVDVIRNSFRNSDLSPGAESWPSSWDHGKMEFNLWWRKSYTTSLDWWTNHLNFEVQLTTGIKWHSNDYTENGIL